MSQDIHFNCHQCGRCCNKKLFLHFHDMLLLSDEFIFQTAHHGFLSYANQPLDKVTISHYQALGHTIMLPEFNLSLFYYIDFTPLNPSRYQTCPKLKNNLCSIYHKRQSACKLSPFDYSIDDTQQLKTIQIFQEQVKENQWNCSFNDNNPLIYKEQQIYQPYQNSIYFEAVDLIRNFTDKYIELLGMADKTKQEEHFKVLYDSVKNQTLMVTDLVVPLQVARHYQLITEEEANQFLHNQISLIKKEINPVMSFIRKENTQTYHLYKQQKNEYEKAIQNQLFK